jgi:hypothetical protein
MSMSTLRWAGGSALALISGLAACSGQQPGSTGFVPGGANAAQAARPDGLSRMAPDAKGKDLLYVSDDSSNDVYVYSYPKLKPEGTLTGFDDPFGECVDKSGDVFIANDEASDIVEYAHGGTSPIATLEDPGYYPRGCSIDPTTGNLAVVNIVSTSLGQGNIVIYKDAKGKPSAYYSDSNVYNVYSCGYDNAGNLFVDGENEESSSFEFAELPSGAKKFKNISLNQAIAVAGGVQWDGKYVAVGNNSGDIYQFSIHGTKGTKVGTTPLNGVYVSDEFWIQGSKVVVPYANASRLGRVGIWDYPAGGSAKKLITGINSPAGATVSKAGQ